MPSERAVAEANKRGGYLDIGENDFPWKPLFRIMHREGEISIRNAVKHFFNPHHTIELVFFKSNKFNAFALSDGSFRVIGISAAVIPRLWHLAKLTLCNKANFMGHMYPYEGPHADLLELLLHDKDLYAPHQGGTVQGEIESVVRIGLDILISHELCHFINGHLGWQKDNAGLNLIVEASASSSSLPSIVRKTLEWDADTIGITRAFLRALGTVPPDVSGLNRHTYFDLPSYNTHGNAQQAIYLFKIATMVLFCCMDRERAALLSNDSYPSPKMRRSYAISLIDHAFSSRIFPITLENAKDMYPFYFGPSLSAFSRFEDAWSYLYEEDLPDFKGATDNESLMELESYHQCLREITGELYNFMLAPTAWDSF